MDSQKKKTIIVTGILLLLLLVIGSTYAYFSIQASNNQTGANIKGSAARLGNPTLRTEVANLYLNLDANLMSQANAGKTYYANKDESGLALTTNPNYTLATASVNDADAPLDCTYNYKVTATVTKAITDGSDSNVIVTIGNKTMTLKELTTAGTDGIIVSGELKNLVSGTSQTIRLSSSVQNTTSTQDNLVGNSYTINIAPYTSGDTKAFSCKLHEEDSTLATYLIDNANLWQSGLAGDGYRYVGTGEPGDDANPNNFICFGTNDYDECINVKEQFMYRIIGIFQDSNGQNHVKLIKYNQIGPYKWHSDYSTDTSWENSDMYKGLNGSYFLTNSDFDYLQNNTWLNKITDWTWSIVNTQSYENNSKNVYYRYSSPSGIYLNEMNKKSSQLLCKNQMKESINCNYGSWKKVTGKIGLLYASDYALSIGNNNDSNIVGWMNPSNNDVSISQNEWLMARSGLDDETNKAYTSTLNSNQLSDGFVSYENNGGVAVRPVFYLKADTKIVLDDSLDGSENNPYMIEQ